MTITRSARLKSFGSESTVIVLEALLQLCFVNDPLYFGRFSEWKVLKATDRLTMSVFAFKVTLKTDPGPRTICHFLINSYASMEGKIKSYA